MAKSSELLALRGKIAGKSFYAMKGVEGTLVRSINEGLSNRVKNDAAFANTRLNAAEFGSAGNFAGALVRTVSRRWRYILKAFSTAFMTKALREIIQLDTMNNWGRRKISVLGWPSKVTQSLQSMVKNPYEENFALDLNVSLSGSTLTVVVDVKASDSVELAAKGADGVRYEIFHQIVTVPTFDDASGKYTKSIAKDLYLGTGDANLGTAQTITVTENNYTPGSGSAFDNVLVVALPYRTMNGQKHVLQELCSCKWVDTLAVE